MHYLHKSLEFDSVEEGEQKLAAARELRDQMGGALYWGILDEDCQEIQAKIEQLRREGKFNFKLDLDAE